MRFPVGDNYEDFIKNWYNAQGYGAKTSYGYHDGDDFNLKTGGDSDLGKPVYAIADGIVTSVHNHTTKPTFGKHVHVKHEGEWGVVYSHYAHLNDVLVNQDQEIKEGKLIGHLGKSGTEYAHLHFSVKNQPTGVDGIPKTQDDLKKWENPTEFIRKWKGSMTNELQECLRQHTLLVDETTSLKKQIENLKANAEAFQTDVDNIKKDYEEKIKILKVELDGKLKLETELQQEKDSRREDNLRWENKRLEWEGEMEKIKQQLASEDLSLRDYQVLLRALVKKILRDIESLKK